MLRVDGKKLEEIRKYYEEQSKREVARAINNPELDMKDDDIEAIKNKWKFQENEHIKTIVNLNPKRMYQLGYHLESDGWREGYTKSPLKKRAQKRRAQKKFANKTRKLQRRK